jgi:hypothetical protein
MDCFFASGHLTTRFSNASLDPLIDFTFNKRDCASTYLDWLRKAMFANQSVNPRFTVASPAADLR